MVDWTPQLSSLATTPMPAELKSQSWVSNTVPQAAAEKPATSQIRIWDMSWRAFAEVEPRMVVRGAAPWLPGALGGRAPASPPVSTQVFAGCGQGVEHVEPGPPKVAPAVL